MKTCQYCGKPIRWERTKKGKHMPCDLAAVYFVPDPQGELYVLNGIGEMVRARERIGNEVPVRVGFIPHFTTCRDLPPRVRTKERATAKAQTQIKREKPKAAEQIQQLRLWPEGDKKRWMG